MAIKPAVVEHIFRRVWARHAGEADAEEKRAFEDESDGDGESTADDGDGARAPRSAARVTKLSGDALKLSSEFLRLFVEEALRRAQIEAMVDDSAAVEPHHVEQILAQLLLDF